MDYAAKKDAVLKLLEPWVGVRSAEVLKENETPDDEVEVRIFDWAKVENREEVVEALGDMFDDAEDEDFEGLRREVSEDFDSPWPGFADNWLPIAITGTGGQKFVSHDDEDFYFPQFSYMVFVNLDELDGESTPLYGLDVDGTVIPSPDVPRFEIGGVAQTIGSWKLGEPVNPEGDF